MKRIAIAAALFMLALATAVPAVADMSDLIRTGDEHYVNKNDGHAGSTLAPGPIAKAIASYEQALAEGPNSVEAAWKLMRALYFQGTYADMEKDTAKAIFKRGTDLGERALAIAPDSVHVHFWLAVHWGRFGELFGIIASAKEGVAEKIRDHAQKVIDLDPSYEMGGGYRVLGRLHQQAPWVVFWASDEEGLRLLEKANQIDPVFVLNKLYYAEVLENCKQKDKAITVLEDLLDDPIDPSDAVTWVDARESAAHDLEEWR